MQSTFKRTLPVRLLNMAMIMFIYMNILMPKFGVFGIPFSKALFAAMLAFFMFHLASHKIVRFRSYAVYVGVAFLSVLLLANISMYLGNDFQDIMGFVYSLTVLLSIPVFVFLYAQYGLETYLNHILIASALLSIYVVSLYLFFAQFPTWNPLVYYFNELKILGTSVVYRDSGPQISLVSSGWLPVCLIIVVRKLTLGFRIEYLLCLAMVLFGIYATKMAGIFIAAIFGVAVFALLRPNNTAAKVLSILLILSLSLGALLLVPEEYFALKAESIQQKGAQSGAALSIFSDHLLLGKGLGYKYQEKEIPGLSGHENVFLEATYPMILSSTGLAGMMCYSFVFLFYPVKFLFARKKGQLVSLTFVLYVTVLVEAIGNPFLWGGGLGLLLMSMFIAAFHCNREDTVTPIEVKLCRLAS